MKDRRDIETSPELEDDGLFKEGTVEISIEVTPLIARTARNDILIRGFAGSAEVDVIFPGRRSKNTEPLISRLQRLEKRVRRASRDPNAKPPDPASIRLPIMIEGTWRPRFHEDGSGWTTRTYQLIAARWVFTTESGERAVFGDRPVSRLI